MRAHFYFACYSIERLHGNGGSHLHSVKLLFPGIFFNGCVSFVRFVRALSYYFDT